MEDWLKAEGGAVLVALWDLLTGAVVPIAAALIAAWVVVRQIGQLDRHRADDRRSAAVVELSRVLTGEATIGFDVELANNPTLQRLRLNESYVRALAMLTEKETDVARWVAHQRLVIEQHFLAAVADGELVGDTIGDRRAKMANHAALSMDRLISWQQGETTTKWFRKELRRLS